MSNNQTTNYGTGIKNEMKGRGLFYGVIAVATFIIMAVGATFAYFTATTSSTSTEVQTGSTTLQLKYTSYGTAWMNADLIPANTDVVEYSFEFQNDTTKRTEPVGTATEIPAKGNLLCKDDYGNSICSVYIFQVTNQANSPQSVALNVISEMNSFASLNAMTYEISLPEDLTTYNSKENGNGTNDPVFKSSLEDPTEGAVEVKDGNGAILTPEFYTPLYVNRNGVTKTLLKYIESKDEAAGTEVLRPSIDKLIVPITDNLPPMEEEAGVTARTTRLADNIEIKGGETKTFAIVMYVKNKDEDQTSTDAEKVFQGKVVVSSGDGKTGVSGSIGTMSEELQSGINKPEEPEEGTEEDPDEGV